VVTGVYNEELVWEKQKTEIHKYVSRNMIFCITMENTEVFLFAQIPDRPAV
jgi:hypothetical protein